MQQGDLNAVIDYPRVREHPALVKLMYGLMIHFNDTADNYPKALRDSRIVSAVFGVFATLLVALLDPLAGGLIAIYTLVVKYTSQAYLEAIPLAFMILAVLACLKTSREQRDGWFWLSAFALGVVTAGKFAYTPVLVSVLASGLIFLLLRGTKWPQYMLTIIPAICFMAAESLRRCYAWFSRLSYYRSVE